MGIALRPRESFSEGRGGAAPICTNASVFFVPNGGSCASTKTCASHKRPMMWEILEGLGAMI